MEPEVFVDVVRQALGLVADVTRDCLPFCRFYLVVGLVVSVFQAATSINEQTLSFLPRLLVTVLGLMLGSTLGFN